MLHGIIFSLIACTGFYVGKDVSTDGTTLLCRTADFSPWTTSHRLYLTPRVENVPGRVYRGRNGCTWALPPTTWKVVSTPALTSLEKGRYDSALVNEKGLAITGTVTGRNAAWVPDYDPYVTNGFGEADMPILLAQCCTTARGCVELLGEVVAKVGHKGREIYMFADKDEAWYVEVYTGHEWAAVRMPDDQVACYGNQFMLGDFDPSDPATRSSPGLLTLAQKAGALVPGRRAPIDLRASYAAPIADYGNYRTWYGHAVMAPETAGAYYIERPMPLFYAPNRKIGKQDIFALIRSRYEGTGRCPESTGDKAIRLIGTTKQATCHVISLDPRLPEALRGTIWVALANAEHSVFLPVNGCVSGFAPGYADDQTGDFRYDPRHPAMAFRRLCALAEQDRHWYGTGVRDFWAARERELLSGYAEVLATCDAQAIDAFCTRAQERAFADARRLFDDLMWYVTANNRIVGDGNGATSVPVAPFVATKGAN